MNILLVGEESAGIQTLKALTDGDHRIVAVMASKSKNNSVLAVSYTHLTLPTILRV